MDSASSHDSQGAPPKSLEELFTEINSLAICLKKSSAALHHQDNLPPGGRTVLTIVNQSGELTVPQIARSHSSSRQNIQVLVNRLARMGLVVATSNPAHKRSSLIRLTSQGRQLLERVVERELSVRDVVYDSLTEETVCSATLTLKKLRELLQGTGAGVVASRRGRTPAKTPEKPATPAEDELPVSLL